MKRVCYCNIGRGTQLLLKISIVDIDTDTDTDTRFLFWPIKTSFKSKKIFLKTAWTTMRPLAHLKSFILLVWIVEFPRNDYANRIGPYPSVL
jgi:hypothetical protein